MQIFVVLPKPNHHRNLNRIALEVSAGDTVASLKARIKNADGVQPWRQRLVFDGSVLPDGRATLAELGVVNSSTIQLVETSMQVFVQTGKWVTFSDIASSDTVESFRARFHERTGCPPSQQRFSFCGKSLEDGHTVADYGVRDSSSLQFFPRFPYRRKRTVQLYIEVTDTVGRIKERQKVFIQGRELNDGRVLADYDGALESKTLVNVECRRCWPEKTTKGMVPPVGTLERCTDVEAGAEGKRINKGPEVEEVPAVQRRRFTFFLIDPEPEQ